MKSIQLRLLDKHQTRNKSSLLFCSKFFPLVFSSLLSIPLLKACLVILLSLSHTLLFSQPNDTLIQSISMEILDLINKNRKTQVDIKHTGNMNAVDHLFNLSDSRLELEGKDMIYKHDIARLRKDLGINFKARYYTNYDPAFDPDAGEDAFQGARSRFGFEWNILREGMFGHRQKANRLENEQILESLKDRMEGNGQRLYFRYNMMIYLFNEAKIKLLDAREKQLEKQLEILYKVYFLKGILYKDIVHVKGDIEQIKVQLTNYREYNIWVENTIDVDALKGDYNVYELPILKVDLDFLGNDENRQALVDSIALMEEKVASQRFNILNDVSLQFNAFQNLGYKDDFSNIDRSFSTFSLGISVPAEIFYNKKTRKARTYSRLKERLKFNNYEQLNRYSEIINYYYEYNYKLKQYMQFIHKEILYRENIRMEVVDQKNYMDIYRSLRILRYMDVLRDVQLELLDLKRQMYTLLMRIYGKTHYKSIKPFVRPLEVEDFYNRLPGRRAAVLDNNVFNNFDKYFIKDYLVSNAIEKVIVEDAGNPSIKLKEMVAYLQANKIEVVKNLNDRKLMTGDDGMANIVAALDRESYNGVMLDLAQHNSAAWLNKTRDYLLQKFDFFADTNRFPKGSASGISIKLSKGYPLEFLHSLSKECDQITLKINRDTDLGYLEELSKRGFNEKKKLSLSLDAASFKDRVEMEAFIDMINSVYNIENVMIEGLSDFIALDTKAIIKPE